MFDTEFLLDGDTVKKIKLSLDDLQMLKNVDEISIADLSYTISKVKYSVNDKCVEIWIDEVE